MTIVAMVISKWWLYGCRFHLKRNDVNILFTANLIMKKKKSILIVNWGTQDKEYTLKAADDKKLEIYSATSLNYPSWVSKYVPKDFFKSFMARSV